MIIESATDWEWFKSKLDVDAKYKHRHNGNPERYPFKVKSHWWDDPNGPYTYDHLFIYQQDVVCDHCGAKKIVWPETPDE